jgi:hypothetical protein
MGMKILLEFVGFRLNGILGFLLRSGIHGVVLKVLWEWFVVPFINLPKLSIPIAMGIYLIVAFVKKNGNGELLGLEKKTASHNAVKEKK